MMDLPGIVASPRKMGNCELTVKAIAEKVPPPVRLRIVRLAGKAVRSCKACYRCLSGECPIQDDFGAVLAAIVSADALIVAAPTYLRDRARLKGCRPPLRRGGVHLTRMRTA